MAYFFKRGRTVLFCLKLSAVMTLSISDSAAENGGEQYETEEDFFSDIPSVISATRIRQPLTEAPSSVTVIDREMIEASGAIELADVLRLVPGVQVSYPQGNQIAVTYHGFADSFPRKMQMLVDGRTIYQSSFANIDWLFIGVALEDVVRIEVVRGPNSPLYGANSVQGVINIITSQPYQVAGTYVGFTGGSLDTRNGIIRHANNIGALDYRVTASYEEASGLPGDIDSTNDGREIIGLSFRGVLQKSLNDEIDIQIGIDDGRLGAGAEITEDPPAHNKKVSTDYQYINWRHTFENGGDSRLYFYRNAYNSEDQFQDLLSHAFNETPATVESLLEGRPDQYVEFGIYDYEGDRYDLEWQYTSPRKGNWRSIIGVGTRLDRIRSLVITNQGDWINEYSSRIFSSTEYRPTESLIAGLGLMMEDSDQFGTYVSPRVSINYLFTPEYSLRMSYTRVKRNPSLFEDNFKFVLELNDGTEFLEARRSLELEAETVSSAEIGFIGYWMDRKLFLDIKVFKEQTEDVIHELIDPTISQPFPNIPRPVLVFDNDGTFDVEGIETQVKYQFGPRDFISLQYAYMEADSTLINRADSNFWGRSVPRHTASALISHSFSAGYNASITYYSVSEMSWLGDGDLLDDYQRLDFRLASHWKIGKQRLQTEFIVQNMGEDYYTFRDENLFETRYFVRLGLDL